MLTKANKTANAIPKKLAVKATPIFAPRASDH